MNLKPSYLICIPAIVLLTSCASAPKTEVDINEVISRINTLAFTATQCVESKTATGISCTAFVKQFNNGGGEDLKVYTENISSVFEKDPDIVTEVTSNALLITDTLLYVFENNKPNP